MMKIKCKKFITAILSLMIGAVLLAPAVTYAQNDTATSTPTKTVKDPCAIYSEKMATLAQKTADNQANLDLKRANQLSSLNNKRADFDNRLAGSRLNSDQKRAVQIGKLMDRASTTDAQKAAIASFQSAVEKAVADRRTAIDSAIAAYRAALDKALADRKTSVDQATSAYKDAVKAAYAKALNDCQAKVDKKTVRKNLNADLKAAKTKFNTDRQSINKFIVLIAPLAKTRQQAINDAAKSYQTAINAARTDLKAAFPPKTKKSK